VIERTLDRFRHYLRELHAPEDAPDTEPSGFDWAAMAGQFTALRHDVNLQTKAVRAAVEQNAEALKLLAKPAEAPAPALPIKPLLEIADTLALARKQVERSAETLRPLLQELQAEPAPQGFFAKLFGAKPSKAPELAGKLAPMLGGIGEGYTMSLRRVENLLEQLGLEPIDTHDKAFDPESMEAIEVVEGSGVPIGKVVEEVRRGYRQAGGIFRFAQVKVAR
jgi:molecular chaperone GrpE